MCQSFNIEHQFHKEWSEVKMKYIRTTYEGIRLHVQNGREESETCYGNQRCSLKYIHYIKLISRIRSMNWYDFKTRITFLKYTMTCGNSSHLQKLLLITLYTSIQQNIITFLFLLFFNLFHDNRSSSFQYKYAFEKTIKKMFFTAVCLIYYIETWQIGKFMDNFKLSAL